MATKADFTEQEWEALRKGVLGSGLLVAVSDRSFFDTFKEAAALARHVSGAKESSTSELIRGLADEGRTGFDPRASQEEVESETMEALRTAKATLEAKAPDDWEAYKQFVLEVVESVAKAAGGGEEAESAAIQKVREALA